MQLQLPFPVPGAPSDVSGAQSETRVRRVAPSAVVEFVRVRRARRYILRVRPDGTLRVTVPRGGSRREAQEFIEQHRTWINAERWRVHAEHAPTDWYENDEILLRGTLVRIRLDGQVVSYGDRRVDLRGRDIRQAIEADLRELATAEIVPRLGELATQHGLKPRGVTIRNQRSRWGSCAKNGNIALNFRLVQMPPAIRDYVLLHELMHLRQQNHSRRFWRLVEAVFPDCREAERWLRTQGRALF
jgi:predicted metal-dependent hydrolase